MDKMNGFMSDEAMKVFTQSLKIMWQGMFGILLVMIIIALIVFLFSKFSKPNKKED